MKPNNLILLCSILSLNVINAQQTKSQTTKSTTINSCDEIKKENDFLKKTLKINEPLKTYSDNDIEIKLVSAKGNIKTQKITIEYLVTNKIQIRNFKIDAYQDQIVSMSGDLIPISKGYSVFDIQLNTDIPIKTTIELGPILPENTIIKFLTMKYFIPKNGYTYIGFSEPTGIAEFKDIPITWQ